MGPAMDRPADVIQQLRADMGLSQARASSLAGLSRSTWSAAESGGRPRPSTKAAIARALGVTPSRIWPALPRSLHLHDFEDPRWEGAVRRLAQRLQDEGSAAERSAFGERLLRALDCADAGEPLARSQAPRWDPLWRLGGALVGEPHAQDMAIVAGRLVEPARPICTAPRSGEEIAVRRAHGHARRGER